MVIIGGPFLGKTNNCSGKDGANDDANNVAKEGYEEASPLRIIFYNHCDIVMNLYTTPSPNCGEEYPRPQQHDEYAT